MKPIATNLPLNTVTSSDKRSTSTVHFFEKYLTFKLENDHTQRKLFYDEIDKIVVKDKKWIHFISMGISIGFLVASISVFLYESSNFWNLITAVLLVAFSIANYAEGKNKRIQVKNGGLTIDLFRSSNDKELNEVLHLLESVVLENNGVQF
ncbi:MAG: hypothetical protein P8H87_08420 [Flavobacteriaceae bacterium]|nr:hypothetical protein [Flavobacteriaceae bacterium]